ncbi:hypothetical protein DFH27DRAFT_637749 [Peziza echinospora]|nr:hypothetical protein DFH27DRAFT_637749 [Peziza echinospora]
MASQHDETKWAAIYQQYIRSTKKGRAGEAEEREKMKGLILKAVTVREEAVEALQVSKIQAMEESLRKSEMEVLRAQGNIQGLKATQAKRKAEEKKREGQESKKEEGEWKLRDCKMSEVVVLLDVAPALERDTDVEMGGVEPLINGQSPPPNSPKKTRGKANTGAATKPWESPQNWRKAEARKEREKEKSAAPAQAEMAKAVVIHAIPTGWNVGWVANTVGGRLGQVIGVRWLLGEKRREGKTASSVVVYLQKEILVGNGARIRVGGGQHLMVPYNF